MFLPSVKMYALFSYAFGLENDNCVVAIRAVRFSCVSFGWRIFYFGGIKLKVTEAMYTILFNGITDAHRKIREAQRLVEESANILESVQIEAEKLFIDESE